MNAPLYAWATILADGSVSLIGMHLPDLEAHVPLVGFKREVIEGLRHHAIEHGRLHNQSVFLVRYDRLSILESTHFDRGN